MCRTDRFARFNGFLNALELVIAANAEANAATYAGAELLVGELRKAAADLEAGERAHTEPRPAAND